MSNQLKIVSLEEFQQAIKDQNCDTVNAKFVCPRCGTEQSAQDLIDAGAGKDWEDVQPFLAFSCVGRFDDSKGCNWTLGGFLQIHNLEVRFAGKTYPRFEPVNLRARESDHD